MLVANPRLSHNGDGEISLEEVFAISLGKDRLIEISEDGRLEVLLFHPAVHPLPGYGRAGCVHIVPTGLTPGVLTMPLRGSPRLAAAQQAQAIIADIMFEHKRT